MGNKPSVRYMAWSRLSSTSESLYTPVFLYNGDFEVVLEDEWSCSTIPASYPAAIISRPIGFDTNVDAEPITSRHIHIHTHATWIYTLTAELFGPSTGHSTLQLLERLAVSLLSPACRNGAFLQFHTLHLLVPTLDTIPLCDLLEEPRSFCLGK